MIDHENKCIKPAKLSGVGEDAVSNLSDPDRKSENNTVKALDSLFTDMFGQSVIRIASVCGDFQRSEAMH